MDAKAKVISMVLLATQRRDGDEVISWTRPPTRILDIKRKNKTTEKNTPLHRGDGHIKKNIAIKSA
jgi:hypothetical protein